MRPKPGLGGCSALLPVTGYPADSIGQWIEIFDADRRIREMIRKLKSGEYRIYSRKVDPKTGKRRNLGTFQSKEAAQKHEREIQYFKRH